MHTIYHCRKFLTKKEREKNVDFIENALKANNWTKQNLAPPGNNYINSIMDEYIKDNKKIWMSDTHIHLFKRHYDLWPEKTICIDNLRIDEDEETKILEFIETRYSAKQIANRIIWLVVFLVALDIVLSIADRL